MFTLKHFISLGSYKARLISLVIVGAVLTVSTLLFWEKADAVNIWKATEFSMEPGAVAVDDHNGDTSFIVVFPREGRVERHYPDGGVKPIVVQEDKRKEGDSDSAITTELGYPDGVAVNRRGDIYVLDSFYGSILKVDQKGSITKFAGGGPKPGERDCTWPVMSLPEEELGDGGPATEARFCGPTSIATNSKNEVFVADAGNNRLRKIADDASHTVTTIAGNGEPGYLDSPDGPVASASISPEYVAVGPDDNVVFVDRNQEILDSKGRIRALESGKVVTVIGRSDGQNWDVAQGNPPWPTGLDFDLLSSPKGLVVTSSGEIVTSIAMNNGSGAFQLFRFGTSSKQYKPQWLSETHPVRGIAAMSQGGIIFTHQAGTISKFIAPNNIALTENSPGINFLGPRDRFERELDDLLIEIEKKGRGVGLEVIDRHMRKSTDDRSAVAKLAGASVAGVNKPLEAKISTSQNCHRSAAASFLINRQSVLGSKSGRWCSEKVDIVDGSVEDGSSEIDIPQEIMGCIRYFAQENDYYSWRAVMAKKALFLEPT